MTENKDLTHRILENMKQSNYTKYCERLESLMKTFHISKKTMNAELDTGYYTRNKNIVVDVDSFSKLLQRKSKNSVKTILPYSKAFINILKKKDIYLPDNIITDDNTWNYFWHLQIIKKQFHESDFSEENISEFFFTNNQPNMDLQEDEYYINNIKEQLLQEDIISSTLISHILIPCSTLTKDWEWELLCHIANADQTVLDNLRTDLENVVISKLEIISNLMKYRNLLNINFSAPHVNDKSEDLIASISTNLSRVSGYTIEMISDNLDLLLNLNNEIWNIFILFLSIYISDIHNTKPSKLQCDIHNKYFS